MESLKKTTNSFQKGERLSSHSAITDLFLNGKSFYLYPLKVVYLENDQAGNSFPIRLLVSVSKKRFKLAVARNRIKRLVKEAFRTQKSTLIQYAEASGKRFDIALIYTGHQLPDLLLIRKKIKAVIKRLIKNDEKGD